jgi:large subunit ribosomal protein L29
MIKAKDIRLMSDENIAQRLAEEREELSALEFKHAIAQLENPLVLRNKRRLIARLQTILNENSQQAAT